MSKLPDDVRDFRKERGIILSKKETKTLICLRDCAADLR